MTIEEQLKNQREQIVLLTHAVRELRDILANQYIPESNRFVYVDQIVDKLYLY